MTARKLAMAAKIICKCYINEGLPPKRKKEVASKQTEP